MNINRWLTHILFGGLFLIPLVPLVVADGGLFPSILYPFISGKNFAFRILVEIIAAVWIILALRDKKYMPKKSWILGVYAAFMVVLILADITSENPYKSFWSNYERMEGLITHLHLFAYFVVAGSVLVTERLWSRFLHTSLGVSIILCFYGLLQQIGELQIHQGSTRLDATLGNAAYLASYLMFHLFFSVLFLVRYVERNYKTPNWQLWIPLGYIAAILLQAFIIFNTATRGVFIALALTLLAITIVFAWKERRVVLIRKTAIGALIAIVVAIGLLAAFKDTQFVRTNPVLGRLAPLMTLNFKQIAQTEAKSRFTIWPMAWEGVKEQPLLGWGQESFNYVFYKHYQPKMFDQEPWFDRAHNIILDWLIAAGFLGLITYLGIIGAAVYYLWAPKRNHEYREHPRAGEQDTLSFNDRVILTAILAAYIIHNLFVFDNITSYIMVFAVLAYIHSVYGRSFSEKVQQRLHTRGKAIDPIIGPAILIAFVIVFYFFNFKPILAGNYLTYALGSYPEGAKKNLELYRKHFALNTFGSQEGREFLAQLAVRASQAQAQGQLDAATRTEVLNLAVTEMKKQIEKTPRDVRQLYFAGILLTANGRHAEGREFLEKAIEYSPKKQMTIIELGRSYHNEGKHKEAEATMKRAFELEPNYLEARLMYALMALYNGNEAKVKELLVPVYGTDVIMESRFMDAYARLKQYRKLEAVWNAVLKDDPQNFQATLSLAAVYAEQGRVNEAVAQLRKAIELNPSFKDQGEYYIREIQAGNKVTQ